MTEEKVIGDTGTRKKREEGGHWMKKKLEEKVAKLGLISTWKAKKRPERYQ